MASTPAYLKKVDRKTVSVVNLDQADSDDLAYWLTKSPIERLMALEFLRQQYFQYDPYTARLPRLLEIVEPLSG